MMIDIVWLIGYVLFDWIILLLMLLIYIDLSNSLIVDYRLSDWWINLLLLWLIYNYWLKIRIVILMNAWFIVQAYTYSPSGRQVCS